MSVFCLKEGNSCLAWNYHSIPIVQDEIGAISDVIDVVPKTISEEENSDAAPKAIPEEENST